MSLMYVTTHQHGQQRNGDDGCSALSADQADGDATAWVNSGDVSDETANLWQWHRDEECHTLESICAVYCIV